MSSNPNPSTPIRIFSAEEISLVSSGAITSEQLLQRHEVAAQRHRDTERTRRSEHRETSRQMAITANRIIGGLADDSSDEDDKENPNENSNKNKIENSKKNSSETSKENSMELS